MIFSPWVPEEVSPRLATSLEVHTLEMLDLPLWYKSKRGEVVHGAAPRRARWGQPVQLSPSEAPRLGGTGSEERARSPI